MKFKEFAEKMEGRTGVFKITNIENKKCLIGCGTDISERITRFIGRLRRNKFWNKKIQSDFNILGVSYFD